MNKTNHDSVHMFLIGEGKQFHVITYFPTGITFLDGSVFWTQKDSTNVYWQDISSGSHPKHMKLGKPMVT